MASLSAWTFRPVPRWHIAWFRTLVYGFVWIDLLVTTPWVRDHRDLPDSLYQPLALARLLELPRPTPGVVDAVFVLLLASAAVAATGRLPRLAGGTTALLYLAWMLVAMSYGKVDHDRFAFLVALAVLPTVGPARHDDSTADERAGWALRCIELAVVATYVLAVVAKHRYGGGILNWVDSTTLVRAIVRRGTSLADPLLDATWILTVAQWTIVAVELSVAPLILLRNRVGLVAVLYFLGFHLAVFATVTIVFLPHCVCLVGLLLRHPEVPVRPRIQASTLS